MHSSITVNKLKTAIENVADSKACSGYVTVNNQSGFIWESKKIDYPFQMSKFPVSLKLAYWFQSTERWDYQ